MQRERSFSEVILWHFETFFSHSSPHLKTQLYHSAFISTDELGYRKSRDLYFTLRINVRRGFFLFPLLLLAAALCPTLQYITQDKCNPPINTTQETRYFVLCAWARQEVNTWNLVQDKGCNHVSVDVQKRSAALFDWLVAGTLQSSMQTGIHITVPAYCLLRYLLRRWMGKHHQQQPWPWLGLGFLHFHICSPAHFRLYPRAYYRYR